MDPTFHVDTEGLRSVLEQIPDFVLVIDRDGVIQYINRLEEGYEMDQVVGSSARELLLPESREAFDDALKTVWETGTAEDYEIGAITPAGAKEWYRNRMVPLRKEGRTVAALVTSTNITELKTTQRSLDQMRRLLPMCAWCDRIQCDDGEWESIETHLKRESGTEVTHGICPSCSERELEGIPANGGAA